MGGTKTKSNYGYIFHEHEMPPRSLGYREKENERRSRIEKAKEKGVYKGRKPSIDASAVKELKEKGMGASAIAKELGIGRASVYRALEV